MHAKSTKALLLLLLCVFHAQELFAAPESFVYSGRIIKPDRSYLEDPSVDFIVQIFSPGAEDCLLYEEIHTLNMSETNGLFALPVGRGSRSGGQFEDTSTLAEVFNNMGPSVSGLSCAITNTYTPSPGDSRRLRITFNDGSGNVAMDPTVIRSVPYAQYASSLGGFGADDLLQVNGSTNLTQSNIETVFSNFAELQSLLNGSSLQYATRSSNGATELPSFTTGSPPAAPVAGDVWFDSDDGMIKFYDGGGIQTVGTAASTGTVKDITVGAGLVDGSGNPGTVITTSGTIALPTIVAPGSYAKVTVDGFGRVTLGETLDEADIPNLTTAGKVSGDSITSGTIGGSTNIDTNGTVEVDGLITANGGVSSSYFQSQVYRFYDSDNSNFVELRAPNDVTTNFTLKLPVGIGNAGEVLVTDGIDQLSWVDLSRISVGNVTSAAGEYFSYMPNNVECADGEVLKWQATSDRWTCAADSNSDAVASVFGRTGIVIAQGGDYNASQVTNTPAGGIAATTVQAAIDELDSDKQNASAELSGIDGLAGTGLVERTGAGTYTTNTVTAAGKALLDDADATAQRTTLGLGSMAIQNANSVSINGGSIDGTSIGATTAASGAFTSLSASGNTSLGGTFTVAGDTSFSGNVNVAATKTVGIGSFTTSEEGTLISGLGAGDSGKFWYNSDNDELMYWNGSAAVALGISGAGLQSFNGDTTNAQSLSILNGAAVLAPTWNHNMGGDHQLRLPLASAAGVTHGLISKTDYDNFNNKQSRTLNNGQILVGSAGNIATGRTPSGDLTMSNTGVFTLANSGVAASTYKSVSVDAKGRVTAGTNPTSLAGYGITDAIANAGSTPSIQAGTAASIPVAGTAGRLYVATDTLKIYRDTGSVWNVVATTDASDISSGTLSAARLPASGVGAGTYKSVTVDTTGRVTSATNPTTLTGFGITDAVTNAGNTPSIQAGPNASKPAYGTVGRLYISTDTQEIYRDSGSAWVLMGSASGAGGTVTSVSANAPLSISGSGSDPVVELSGVVPVVNGGTGANTAAAARTNLGLGTAAIEDLGSAIGDIPQIKTAFTADALLHWNTVNGGVEPFTCAIGEYLQFGVGGWGCVSSARDTAAFHQNGDSFGALAVLGTNDNNSLAFETNGVERVRISNSGNIGIGTSTPTGVLDINTPTNNFLFTDGASSNTAGLIVNNKANKVLRVGAGSGNSYLVGDSSAPFRIGIDTKANITGPGWTGSTMVDAITINPSANVGIGTSTPAAKLDVAGSVKISGGSPGAGKVLTSDASGLASWQAPAGTGDFMADGSVAMTANLNTNNNKIVNLAAPTGGLDATNKTYVDTAVGGKQDSDADLTGLAGLSTTGFVERTGAGTFSTSTVTAAGKALLDDADANAQRATLGLGTAATQNVGGSINNVTQVKTAFTTDSLVYWDNVVGGIKPLVCSSGQYLEYSGSAWVCVAAPTDATAFHNNGDSFSGLATLGTNDNNALALETNNTERVRITNSGYVGIGTTSPGQKLHVVGTSGNTLRIVDGNQAAGRVLTSDANGVASWQAESGTGDFKADGSVAMTGAFRATSGTAASPGVSFSSDTNTGLHNPAADVLGLSTAGAERLRIDSTGRVGVGTLTPRAKLDVAGGDAFFDVGYGPIWAANTDEAFIKFRSTGDGTGLSYLEIGTTDNGDEPIIFTQSGIERLRVHTNGNVGVGTTTPNAKLSVEGPMSLDQLASDPSGAAGYGTLYTKADGNLYYRNGTGSITNILNLGAGAGDFMKDGSVAMTGAFKATSGTAASPGVGFASDTNTGISNPEADTLGFSTGGAERLRVDSSGRLGIGYTNPTYPVHINAVRTVIDNYGGSAPNLIGRRADGTEASPQALLPNASLFKIIARGHDGTSFTSDRGRIEFESSQGFTSTAQGTRILFDTTTNNSTTMTEKMRIEHNGDVGIGTTSPNAKLTIEGAMSLDQLGSDPSGAAGYGTLYTKADGSLYYRNGTGAVTDLLNLASGAGDFKADGSVAMSGVFKAVDGTQALPGISFNNDLNTGIFRPLADTIAFSTAGSERMRLSSAGFLGIGTTNPQRALDVTGSDTGYIGMKIHNTQSGDPRWDVLMSGTSGVSPGGLSFWNGLHRLVLDKNGSVGIGATTPSSRLSLGNGTTIDGGILARGYGTLGTDGDSIPMTGTGTRMMWYPKKAAFRAGTISATADAWDDTNIGIGSASFGKDNGSAGAQAFTAGEYNWANGNNSVALGRSNIANASRSIAMGEFSEAYGAVAVAMGRNNRASGDYSTALGYKANTGSGYAGTGGNYSMAIGLGNPAGANPYVSGTNSLGIFMGDQSGAAITANNVMAILGGNVGIGTASPEVPLHVEGTLQSANGGGRTKMYHGSNAATGWNNVTHLINSPANGGNGGFAFERYDFTGAYQATHMVISAGGSVGIGTTTPVSSLDINGSGISTRIAPADGGTKHLNMFSGADASSRRFNIGLDDLETGGGVGSDFTIWRYDDAGGTPMQSFRIQRATGYVGIGTANPSYNLDVIGNLRITGTPYRSGGDIAWQVPSDERLKNITGEFEYGLREIASLDTLRFTYKKDNPVGADSSKEYIGVMAQEVQKVMPEAVSTGEENEYLSLNTTPIFWALVNSTKELKNMCESNNVSIEELKAENLEQAREIGFLRAELDTAKEKNKAIEAWICKQDPKAPFCN